MYLIEQMPAPLTDIARSRLEKCEPATIGHFRNAGFVDPEISCRFSEGIIVGPAVTVSFPHGDGTLLNHAMRFLRKGDVLVIDQRGDRRHACWGGVLTEVACQIGLAGVVIDGMATDVCTVRSRRLPVWSRGLAALTTKLNDMGGEMNRPVAIGGVVVNPGDIVLADENGILTMPVSEVENVASHALYLQEEEDKILGRLAAGEILPDISGATRTVNASQRTGRLE